MEIKKNEEIKLGKLLDRKKMVLRATFQMLFFSISLIPFEFYELQFKDHILFNSN